MKTWFRILERLIKDNERRAWIKRMWVEWQRCRRGTGSSHLSHNLSRGEHTWLCLKGTVAIALDRHAPPYVNHWWDWGTVMASAYTGQYMTDWGIGSSFEELRVQGFRYLIASDGTL